MVTEFTFVIEEADLSFAACVGPGSFTPGATI